MSRYSVSLIGLGRVGWTGFPKAPSLETHYQAIKAHPQLSLVAGCDTHPDARRAFQEIAGVPVYESADLLPPSDIAVVAAPASMHQAVLLSVASKVRGVICEKPLAPTLQGCGEIVKAFKDIPLVVGHQRRYEQRHIMLRAFLQSGMLGEPHAATCFFSGDILENGTHAADTLRFLVGDDVAASIMQTGAESFKIIVSCKRGSVSMESRADLEPGYLHAMYDNLIGCIEGREHPICSAEDGMEAVRHAVRYQEEVGAATTPLGV